MSTGYRSSWEKPLPPDEIARQQRMISLLHPGMTVELRGHGRFIYTGLWDTLHIFQPAEGQDLAAVTDPALRPRIHRTLRGTPVVRLPYTLLADYITLVP